MYVDIVEKANYLSPWMKWRVWFIVGRRDSSLPPACRQAGSEWQNRGFSTVSI